MSDTRNDILNRLVANASNSVYDTSKGSWMYDVFKSLSIELETAYKNNENEIKKRHIEDATGKDLDKLVKQWANIDRKNMTYASGKVQITNAIPGSIFYKNNCVSIGEINYSANSDVTADANGNLEVNVTCTTPGSVGNTAENTIIYFPKTLSGFSKSTVTNKDAFTNGYNEETDEELRERYYEKVGNQANGANSAQYVIWAKSITGIGDCKPIENWNGAGTLKLVLLDSNREPASTDLQKQVKDYILTVRPACSGELTVEAASTKAININITIVKDAQYSDDIIKSNISNNINKYLKSAIDFGNDSENYVSYFVLAGIIQTTTGVKRLTALTLNDSNTDVLIGSTEIPILGSVTYE